MVQASLGDELHEDELCPCGEWGRSGNGRIFFVG